MTRRRLPRVTAALGAVAASTALMWALSPTVAHAASEVDCDDPRNMQRVECNQAVQQVTGANQITVTPVPPGSGVSSMITDPDSPNPTTYEQYGSGSYQLTHEYGLLDVDKKAANSLASWMFAGATALVTLAIGVLNWAFSFEFADGIVDVAAGVAGQLTDSTFYPIGIIALMGLGLYIMVHGAMFSRSSFAVTAFASALLWGGLALWAVGNPERSIGALADAGTAAGRIGLAAGGLDTEGDPLREAQDRMWDVYVTRPWWEIQFGSAAAGERWGQQMLEVNTFTASDMRRIAEGDRDDVEREHQDAYNDLVADMEEADPAAAEHVRGGDPMARVGWSAVALIVALVVAVLMIALAGYLALLLVLLVIGGMLSPLVLGFVIYPGWGRRLGLGALSYLAGLVLVRAYTGAGVGVVLTLQSSFVAATVAAGGLLAGWLMSAATILAVFWFRQPILNALRAGGRHMVPTVHRQPLPGSMVVRQVATAAAGSAIVERATSQARTVGRRALDGGGVAVLTPGHRARTADGDGQAAAIPASTGSSIPAPQAAPQWQRQPVPAAAGRAQRSNGQARPQQPAAAVTGAAPSPLDGRGVPPPQIVYVARPVAPLGHLVPNRATLREGARLGTRAPLLPVVEGAAPQQRRQPAPPPVDEDAPRWRKLGPPTPQALRRAEPVPPPTDQDAPQAARRARPPKPTAEVVPGTEPAPRRQGPPPPIPRGGTGK